VGYRTKRLQDFARGLRESKALLERERWPQERLEQFRQERLQELIRHARERSPFWRERIPARTVRLNEIEPTSKADLMESFDELVTDPRLHLDELLQHLDRVEGDELYLGD
jgi:phenylacetate-CoA ligase